MFVKIDSQLINLSKNINFELFIKINNKFIKINNLGSLQDITIKKIGKIDFFIQKEQWHVFFLQHLNLDMMGSLESISQQYELLAVNFAISPSESSFALVSSYTKHFTENYPLTKKNVLEANLNLSKKIILRTLLINKMVNHWNWLGGLVPFGEVELTSVLCDISLYDPSCNFNKHNLESARKCKKMVNQDVYLGILHHTEAPCGSGPFKLDSERIHIYGQFIYFVDQFLNNLEDKNKLDFFIKENPQLNLVEILKKSYHELI